MSVGHYENFPVASVLLPAALRRPVTLIYRFARSADDFADEGDLRPQERLAPDAAPVRPERRPQRRLLGRDLLRAAGHQLLAGCRNRLPQEPHLSSAGG